MSVSVGTKILVPFFMVMLIVVASLPYFVISKISEKIEQMEIRRAVAVLNSTIEQVEEQRKTVETYASLLGGSMEIEQALLTGDKTKLYEILVTAKESSKQQKIVVYDSQGRMVAQVANSPTIHNDAIPLIKKGLGGISTSILTVSENGLEIYAVTPIHSGQEVGVNNPAMLLDRHIGDKELSGIKKREGVDITIISGKTVVATTLDGALANHVLNDILAGARNKKMISSRIIGNNMDFINVWQTVGSNGLISVMVPNNDLIAIKQDLSGDIVSITLMALLLVFLCATVISKIIVAPLQRMLRTTKAITHGDFNQKIDVITRDEFGELGEGINFMAERIKERLDQAEHLATIDGLTGLYNHRFFQQRLAQEVRRAERAGSAVSLILLDIDYFRHYNDHLGHPAGDRVLQQIGKILATSIRSVDIAARYGGEEFAVILVDTGALDAYDVGERIRQAVERFPFVGREGQPTGKITISLGIASYPENAGNKDDLIKLADDALYKAKYISKNKVVLYYSVLDELKTGLDNSEHDLLNTVKTLISMINSRDKYTYGHSERVVQYATAIARAMGLPENDIRDIKVAAFLHDIGKIEISREILNKEAPLTADETEILKQHPSWGAQIVSSINSLKEAVPVILYHHEKYDGTGYPSGLRGNDIPLHARILKLADSFDAMTSLRPYQCTKTHSQARDEIRRCKGTDFDPDLVDVFLRVIGENRLV